MMKRFSHTIARKSSPSSWVIYRDHNVIVLNKPNHIAVHSGTNHHQRDTIDGALDALKFDYTQRPFLVHRLDEATSGALILARTAEVAASLSRLMANRRIVKDYIAVCRRLKRNVPQSGIIYSPVFTAVDRASNDNRRAYGRYIASDLDVNGLAIANAEAANVRATGFECESAATKYSVLDSSDDRDISVVRCRLLTGRKHQIRVHMRVISDGILHDAKHDAQSVARTERPLHLHAHSVILPLNGVLKRIVAPLPEHITSVIESACGSLRCIETDYNRLSDIGTVS